MEGAELCKNCKTFDRFKEKCFFFWKYKKECTQYLASEQDAPKYKKLDF